MTTIHANPAHRWTIAGLAQRSNLSRSAFADRFTRRVGEAPATYIAQLRLANAASLLLETREPVNVVATMVGYEFGSSLQPRLQQALPLAAFQMAARALQRSPAGFGAVRRSFVATRISES